MFHCHFDIWSVDLSAELEHFCPYLVYRNQGRSSAAETLPGWVVEIHFSLNFGPESRNYQMFISMPVSAFQFHIWCALNMLPLMQITHLMFTTVIVFCLQQISFQICWLLKKTVGDPSTLAVTSEPWQWPQYPGSDHRTLAVTPVPWQWPQNHGSDHSTMAPTPRTLTVTPEPWQWPHYPGSDPSTMAPTPELWQWPQYSGSYHSF